MKATKIIGWQKEFTYYIDQAIKNEEIKKEKEKVRKRKRKEKIFRERYYEMWERNGYNRKTVKTNYENNNICEICGTPVSGMKKHQDHNHETKRLRGIICNNCNQGLGQFKDDRKLLKNAINYLIKYDIIEKININNIVKHHKLYKQHLHIDM